MKKWIVDKMVKLLAKLPFTRVLLPYSLETHRDALAKFLFLWIFSVLPVFLGAAMAYATSQKNFLAALRAEFNSTDQFVFSVSYLTPVLFLLWEHKVSLELFIKSGKRKLEDSPRLPDGLGFVIFCALLAFVFTAYGYGATKSTREGNLPLKEMFHTCSFVIYIFAVYCWYVTIFLESSPTPTHVLEDYRKQEKDAVDQFSKRIQEQQSQ